jgi:hypothetical protein
MRLPIDALKATVANGPGGGFDGAANLAGAL